MKKNITILDIAKECGLSKSTVAYTLNPQNMNRVAKKSREKVLATAKRLGYVPSIAARTLRSDKTFGIGVMLPQVTNYFYGALSMALQKVLWDKGYSVFFSFWDNIDDASAIKQNYEKLLSWNVDGIITCSLKGAFPKKTTKPVVFYQATGIKKHDTVYVEPSVLVDGIKILMEKGHRKFALIAPNDKDVRQHAFFDALKLLNLEKNSKWIFKAQENARTMGQKAMKYFLSLDDKPTAIIGHNDMIAIAAMNQAQLQGVRVPEEMAFIGFDGIEEAAFTIPTLTTIRVPVDKVAQLLAETLLDRINNPKKEIMHKTLEPELIIRNSI